MAIDRQGRAVPALAALCVLLMDNKILQTAADDLLAWYTTHYRALPWRQEPTPYRVWVSEIMLQQTRIEAVLPYYDRFMRRLPDVTSLAAVSEEELLKLWEGLGYYSRARNLQKAARVICDRYAGKLPADYDLLCALPGIGEYTAGAIASIAYSLPYPAIDGNVMRVIARLTGDTTDVLSAGAKKHFAAVVEKMLPPEQPGRFNQALMELGETVCLPNTRPQCETCPLSEYCVACRSDLTLRLPVRAKRKPRRVEDRTVAVAVTDEDTPRVLLHKRPASGLLAGLWEFPNAPEGEAALPPLAGVVRFGDLPAAKHLFTHVEWRMRGEYYRLQEAVGVPQDYRWVTAEELQSDFALPSAFRVYTALLPHLLNKEE